MNPLAPRPPDLLSPLGQADDYVRLLIGLRPPAAVRRAIDAYRDLCPELPGPGRTVPHRLHLTLLYAPRIHRGRVEAIARELAQVRFAPLQLESFQPADWNHGVAALLPAAQDDIARLRRQIQSAARRAGLAREAHLPQTAHLTLARHPRASARGMPSLRMRWTCDAFELLHSTAYPAPYEVLARYRA